MRARRWWTYGPDLYGWPIRFGRDGDEFGNPTVYIATWLGWVVLATPRRLSNELEP